MTWWQTLLVSALGGAFSLSLKWLFDLAFHRVKIRGDKDTLVHRVQFEKEFSSYVDIWRQVPDIRSYTVSHDCCMASEYEEQRKKELPTLMDSLSASIGQAEPFLHPDVFEACVSFLRANESFGAITKKLDRFSESVDSKARHQNGDVSAEDQKRLDEHVDIWSDALQKVMDKAEGIKASIRGRIWHS